MYKWLVGSLEAILLADGVPVEKLYPLDVKRAFAKIKEHKDQFVLWGGGAASQQLFRQGEVVMGHIWSTRAGVLDKETKGNLTWTWNQGVLAPGTLLIPKGAPGAADVQKFLASTQDPARQIVLFKLLTNGPANPAASAMMPADLQRYDPGFQANFEKQIPINSQWYADNYDAVQNDFLELFA